MIVMMRMIGRDDDEKALYVCWFGKYMKKRGFDGRRTSQLSSWRSKEDQTCYNHGG
jgi:hypothetical protein